MGKIYHKPYIKKIKQTSKKAKTFDPVILLLGIHLTEKIATQGSSGRALA
jgi:hypothetical protein